MYAALRRNLKHTYGFIAFIAVIGIFAWINLAWDGQIPYGASSFAAITGNATIIDGDTLEIQRLRITRYGIDAPEINQTCHDDEGLIYPCGHRAARALAHKILLRPVSCHPTRNDQYGRIMAYCQTEGESLNRWLVSEGWAVAYTRYSGRYVLAEVVARLAGRGIWAGRFVSPEEWRRQQRR